MNSSSTEDEEQKKDHYQLLGVRRHASIDEVKKAYRVLARKYHPDQGSEASAELFHLVTEGYETLLDSERRNRYNKEMGYEFADLDPIEDLEPEAPPKPQDFSASGRRRVVIGANLTNTEDRWDALRGKLHTDDPHDLKVSQKVALSDPIDTLAIPDESVTPWGEEEEQQRPKQKQKKFSVGGLVNNLFGNFRSPDLQKKRGEMKASFRQELEERLHPSEPLVKTKARKPMAPRSEEEERARFQRSDPRTFQFHLSSVELHFGANREIVIPGSDRNEIRRVKFQIPADIPPGTIMEVSQGWERFTVRIDLRTDTFYGRLGDDLLVNVPVTFGEALSGASFDIAGLEGPVRVQVPAMFDAGVEIVVPDQGFIGGPEGRGCMRIYPFIVAPNHSSPMLQRALDVISTQYSPSGVRPPEGGSLSDAPFVRRWDGGVALPVPVTLSEAVEGCTVVIPTAVGEETIHFKGPWKPEDMLIMHGAGGPPDEVQTKGADLLVFLQVLLPEAVNPETFAAVAAIDQHYVQPVRSGMPRRLGVTDTGASRVAKRPEH